MSHYPRIIDTLGILIDDGYALVCHCERCGLCQGNADLVALAAQLGREFVFVHPYERVLSPHLICPDCYDPMEYRLHPGNQPEVGGAHSLPRRTATPVDTPPGSRDD